MPSTTAVRARTVLAWTMLGVMAMLGAKRVVLQSRALLLDPGYPAAFDLALRYHETQDWFAGVPVYSGREDVTDYPPATYVVLWPFLGRWSWPTARALWCATNLAALAALSWMFARAVSGPPRWRAFAALLPWAAFPMAITVGVGQLGNVTLLAALAAALLAYGRRAPLRDALGASALVVAMAKPTLAAPLALATLTAPAWGMAVGGAVAYGGLSLFACGAQPLPLSECLTGWIDNGVGFSSVGYGNLATWAGRLGHASWTLPLAVLALMGAAAWLYRARTTDVWLQLGVLAGVARLWTYHYWADDVLLVVPIVALLRAAAQEPERATLARAVALLGVVLLLLPTRLRDPGAWPGLLQAASTLTLLAMLTVLVALAEVRRRRTATPAT